MFFNTAQSKILMLSNITVQIERKELHDKLKYFVPRLFFDVVVFYR